MNNCSHCREALQSHREKPFVPYSGNINDQLHHCPSCGANWFQYNKYFHLWCRVQFEVVEAILQGRDVTIDIGTGTIVPGPAMSE